MELCGLTTAPDAVQNQIARVVDAWRTRLRGALVGVYLHGSLALGCFRAGASDIDLLVVCSRAIPRQERLALAGDMLALDNRPSPLELSALRLSDLRPWRHPARCQFHYSGFWAERYRQMLADPAAASLILDTDFEDADIACHARLAKQSGVCLCGAPIADVFPDVPEKDFWASLTADIAEYDFHAYEPRAYASNILLLGRVLSYKREGRILSKYDGGLWTLARVPEPLRYIVRAALDAWYGDRPMPAIPPGDEEALREYLVKEIQDERG